MTFTDLEKSISLKEINFNLKKKSFVAVKIGV